MPRSFMPFSNPSKLKADTLHASKVAIAAVLAYLVTSAFELPQAIWAVVTAVVVMQANVGGTLTAAKERAIGTVVGAFCGGFAAWLEPSTFLATATTIFLCAGGLSYAASKYPMLRVAPITAILLIGATAQSTGGNLHLAIDRVIEILIGAGIGVAVTALIFPVQWRKEMFAQAQEWGVQFATILHTIASIGSNPIGDQALFGVHMALRRQLGTMEKTLADASNAPGDLASFEKWNALVRAFWRVRNDSVAIGRAFVASKAMNQNEIIAIAQHILESQANYVETMFLPQGDVTSAGVTVEAEQKNLREAIDRMRIDPASAPSDFAETAPLLSLTFSLQSLTRNLGELADRLRDVEKPSIG